MEHLSQPLLLTNAMIVSGIVLAVTFIGIFTEQIHGYERSKIASIGAVLMIIVGQIFGFYSPELALEAIDLNVVFLLGAMMTIVAIMIPTGGFNVLAYKIANISRGRPYLLLVMMGTVVTGISLLLDNVTTVVIFGPLIILICQAQKISPIPYLLVAALLSDTGGVATLVGDPPNLMIGSAADIDFYTFIKRMWWPVLIAWLSILLFFKIQFRKELSVIPADTSGLSVEIKNARVWNASLFILGIMVIFFMIHHQLGWEPWLVAVLGMSALAIASRHIQMDKTFEHVEISLLTFFIGLFIVIGGVEQSGLLRYIGQFIVPYVQADILWATITLMWVAAIFSAMIDNIPFTAAMIPIILNMEMQGINVTSLWWALALGVGMGGNGTHIGSTANVYIVTISERLARQENDPSLAITPGVWFRKGTPAMIITLITSSLCMYFFFDWFANPLH